MKTIARQDGWMLGAPIAQRSVGDVLAQHLLSIADGGFAGAICGAPFVFGGRHELGRLAFVSLVALAAVAWFLRQCLTSRAVWRRSPAFAILLLAAVVVGLQLAPLSTDWLARLAPRTGQLLPLWAGGGDALGAWHTLTLTPRETTLSLAMLLSYGLLFTVVMQRIETIADAERLLNLIAIAATAMAVFGLAQFAASNGKFFWFYQHPFRTTSDFATGSFMNRNHFASFLVLGVGPLVRALVVELRSQRAATPRGGIALSSPALVRPVLIMAALVPVLLGILLSYSRGGALALAAATLVLSACYLRWRLVDSRYLYALAAMGVLMLGLLSLYGYDEVANRLDDFVSGSVESLDEGDARRNVWAANAAAIEQGGLLGAGAGSHQQICPVYLTKPTRRYYSHAENGYLQIVTENGWIGAALLAAGLVLIGGWLVAGFYRLRDPRMQLCFGAAAAGIVGSLVHSIVDFVWYIPACLSVALVLVAVLVRVAQLGLPAAAEPRISWQLPRARWIEATALVSLVAGWSVYVFVGPGIAAVHWDRYLRDAVARAQLFGDQSLPTAKAITSAQQAMDEPLEQSMLRHLNDVVRWDPSFAPAHLQLAARNVQRFERLRAQAANAMTPAQIRDAAFASGFASRDELQAWLKRAFGEHIELLVAAQQHARCAVAASPLEGEGYVYLAELGFLAGDTRALAEACFHQAELVRPYDGDVTFAVGIQALLAGDLDSAMRYWSRCYPISGGHQLRIVGLLAGKVPAATYLENLQPDWRTLRPIWAIYRREGQPADLQALVTYAAALTEREVASKLAPKPAYLWLALSQMYTDLRQPEPALACLEKAYQCDTHVFEVRYQLGFTLKAQNRLAEAEAHLRWCMARRPDDKALGNALVEISKRRAIPHQAGVTASLAPTNY